MEKEPQFIPQKSPSDVDSLFNELGSELDMGSMDASSGLSKTVGKHPLEITKLISQFLVGLVAI
jgi:hypothetical protein